MEIAEFGPWAKEPSGLTNEHTLCQIYNILYLLKKWTGFVLLYQVFADCMCYEINESLPTVLPSSIM